MVLDISKTVGYINIIKEKGGLMGETKGIDLEAIGRAFERTQEKGSRGNHQAQQDSVHQHRGRGDTFKGCGIEGEEVGHASATFQ